MQRLCRPFILKLLPCDVVGFTQAWQRVRSHPVLTIVWAMSKESLDTSVWLETDFMHK